MYDLEDTLNFMKKHFFQSWYFATYESNRVWNTKTTFYCFKSFIDYSISHYKYTFKKWLSRKKCIKVAKSFCRKLKGCDYIITYDEYCTPCIDVHFARRKDAKLEDVIKDVILYDKISEQYLSDLDINPMFILDEDKKATSKDIEKDKELIAHFYDYAKEIKSVLDTKGNIDLQEDLGITNVIDMKIGGVL